MKKSLRFKITLWLVLMVSLIMVIGLVVCRIFLGDFYLQGKKSALILAYQEINQEYQKALNVMYSPEAIDYQEIIDAEEVLSDYLEQKAENTGMSILIFRDSGQITYDYRRNAYVEKKPIIYSSIGMDAEDNLDNMNMYNDFQGAGEDSNVLKNESNYQIMKVYVPRLSTDYIYLSAILDNGDHLLLRASFESIDDSADIAFSFILYVFIATILAGGLMMIYLTGRFTKPIVELSAQAKKIAKLNFDTRYEGQTKDEIGELGASINYLSDSLEKALGELKTANSQLQKDLEVRNRNDEMRKEFLSNVSHELKTPIALIQGYAEGLMENINDDPESQQFYCEVIADEAAKMNKIVGKLLDLNQLEFGKVQVDMQHFDIIEVIRNYLDNSDILLKQRQLTLKLSLPDSAFVWADVFMVEEIFNNYFTNALNHVDDLGVIGVSVDQREDVTRVTVFNTGEHIPEEDIDRIWDKFYKVDKARTRAYGGSGVGLSIVKASMDILGQKYGVENVDQGVAFYFELDSKNQT